MTVQDSVAVQALAARLGPDFQLGVASAAFQIEGSLAAGGRGPSGWDAFAEKPGSIQDGHSPAVACDHYNRAAEDVELMRTLGIDSYRFSHLLAADPAGRHRPFNSDGPRLLRPAASTSCSRPASPPWPPCTTGTPRCRWNTAAAG